MKDLQLPGEAYGLTGVGQQKDTEKGLTISDLFIILRPHLYDVCFKILKKAVKTLQ